MKDAEPTYQQIQLDPKDAPNQWHLIAGPNENAPMHLRQVAEVKTAVLEAGQSLDVNKTQTFNYIHVVEGEVEIAGQIVKTGDALMFDENSTVKANQNTQMIWFDLPR